MLFLPDKCQVLKAILPALLRRLPNNLLSLAMGSCQAFCIHAHLSLPNVSKRGSVQILPAPFASFAPLCSVTGFPFVLCHSGTGQEFVRRYSITTCAIEQPLPWSCISE